MNKAIIEHEGIVRKVKDGKVVVSLSNVSSCGTCVVKSVCSVSDIDNKELELDAHQMDFSIGEHIKIGYDHLLGPKAMMLGYFLPFVLLFMVLLIMWRITHDELISALTSLSSLAPYYLTVWLFREKLKNTFSFKIRKLQAEI